MPLVARDESGDVGQSLEHLKPFDSVYLIVKTDEGNWSFPQKIVQEENSLDEAGLKAIQGHASNKDLGVVVQNRLPISVHENKYSKRFREHTNCEGVKTFFMKGRYVKGNFRGNQFMWCCKDQLKNYIPEKVLKCVEPCLT